MSSPLPQGFNPHSRTGSDPSSEDMAASVQRFNPHSRTGSDRPRPALRRSFRVSIHTPARGVTITHTSGFWRTFCFNPHSRTGSDRQERRQPLGYRTVSIHTPARGVTHSVRRSGYGRGVSIHTPARGVTKFPTSYRWVVTFQSTLPHGE